MAKSLCRYWYTYMYIMPKSQISNVANMSFDDIRENKLLAKISEFIVSEQNRMFI